MNKLRSSLASLRARGARLTLAATIVGTGLAFVTTSGTAYATQWCAATGTACLNAWGGGPEVNVYSPGAAKNNFNLIPNGVYYNLQFAGSGTYHGWCVGDYGDNSTDARAGMVGGCGTSNIGWGGNYYADPCTGVNGGAGEYFNNYHWAAFLGPYAGVGTAFYLNKPSGWCFSIL